MTNLAFLSYRFDRNNTRARRGSRGSNLTTTAHPKPSRAAYYAPIQVLLPSGIATRVIGGELAATALMAILINTTGFAYFDTGSWQAFSSEGALATNAVAGIRYKREVDLAHGTAYVWCVVAFNDALRDRLL